MNRLLRPVVLVSLGLLSVAGRSPAALAPGPQRLLQLPTDLGQTLGFAPWAELSLGRWPAALRKRITQTLAGGEGLLLVGQTDPVGPRALNRALGLEYAFRAARSLVSEVGADAWRLGCATTGEESDATPGVLVYPWRPAAPAQVPESRVAVLEPTPGVPRGSRFWALWEPSPDPVLWAWEGADGVRLWELELRGEPISLPIPARAGRLALGAAYDGSGRDVVGRSLPEAISDRALEVRVESLESWSARLSVATPAGYVEPVLWASGIPYRFLQKPGGGASLSVALFPQGNSAYLQALDGRGRVVFGPVSLLPDGAGDPPELLAVLSWDADGADLDLHAWSGSFHTHAQDPDPAFSAAAVPGARLLFDGDAEAPASAIAVWGKREISLEARCYSDLGGRGSRALFFVVERPGDTLTTRYRILGPRRLSESPLETRWAAFTGPMTEGEGH